MMLTEALVAPPSSDTASFEQFFRLHFGRVYGLLYRVTGNAEDAEDLAQELFLEVSQRRPPLWESPAAAAWLWKAASHRALNALRGDRRRQDRETRAAVQERPLRLLDELDGDPAASAERHERQEAVRQVLRRLKQKESAMLLLRHSGLSYGEVAAALGLKAASVGTLLARAEQRFKDQYHAHLRQSAPAVPFQKEENDA